VGSVGQEGRDLMTGVAVCGGRERDIKKASVMVGENTIDGRKRKKLIEKFFQPRRKTNN